MHVYILFLETTKQRRTTSKNRIDLQYRNRVNPNILYQTVHLAPALEYLVAQSETPKANFNRLIHKTPISTKF